jgi:hypothetical protein
MSRCALARLHAGTARAVSVPASFGGLPSERLASKEGASVPSSPVLQVRQRRRQAAQLRGAGGTQARGGLRGRAKKRGTGHTSAAQLGPLHADNMPMCQWHGIHHRRSTSRPRQPPCLAPCRRQPTPPAGQRARGAPREEPRPPRRPSRLGRGLKGRRARATQCSAELSKAVLAEREANRSQLVLLHEATSSRRFAKHHRAASLQDELTWRLREARQLRRRRQRHRGAARIPARQHGWVSSRRPPRSKPSVAEQLCSAVGVSPGCYCARGAVPSLGLRAAQRGERCAAGAGGLGAVGRGGRGGGEAREGGGGGEGGRQVASAENRRQRRRRRIGWR